MLYRRLLLRPGWSSGSGMRPRMGPIVDLRELLEIEVGVDLGGRDVRMPEQLLHRA